MAEGAVHGVENGVENSVSSFGERIPSLQWIIALKCGACKPFGAYILPLNGAKIIIYIYRGTDCPLFFEFFTPMYIDSRRVSHHSKKKM